MSGITRVISTLVGIAGAGVLLWAAGQVDRGSTGGYWAACAIVAAAGLVLGLSQLRGRTGHPRTMFAVVFLPVLVVAGWVLVAVEPHSNWFRSHALAWSADLGVRSVVVDIGVWVGVLAFAIGYTLGVTLERTPRRKVVPAYDTPTAEEPWTAERHEVAVDEAPTTTDEPAPVL